MIPFYGMVLKWMGSVPASRGNIRKALTKGSCAVVVDGIAGMYVNEPKKEMIKFSGRLGFIRAAVETGTPILPVYQFGTSQIMKLVPKCFESFARKISCATGIMIGRWNLPIPKKVMLMSVIGSEVQVKKMDKNDPKFDEYVNEVQQLVADEIQRVYYKYRGIYGWSDRPLELY